MAVVERFGQHQPVRIVRPVIVDVLSVVFLSEDVSSQSNVRLPLTPQFDLGVLVFVKVCMDAKRTSFMFCVLTQPLFDCPEIFDRWFITGFVGEEGL